MIPAPRLQRNPAAVLLLVTLISGASLAAAPLEDAVRLYDAGRYAEARPLLERAVAAGNADGPTYYRLYFCQRSVGDAAQDATLETARERLEAELDSSASFEVPFYLASAYNTLGRNEDVRRVASRATARLESGALSAPTTATGQFRLGKLYADQGRDADATPWLDRAADGFANSGDSASHPYLAWTARWLGERAVREERYESAADAYARLATADTPALQDYDNQGLACLMIGRYEQAVDAWRNAAKLNPSEADRYRYGYGLAALAATASDLPISPDGERSWDEATVEELEQILRDQSQQVRDIRGEIEATEKLDTKTRDEFNERLQSVQPMFVAAAMEYLRRGLSLREAAFFGGYAPLIFHANEWQASRGQAGRKWTVAEVRAERERLMAERAAAGAKGATPEDTKAKKEKKKKGKKKKADQD